MTQKNWDRQRISLTVTAVLFAVISLAMAGPVARFSDALTGAMGREGYNATLLILELLVSLGLGFFLLIKLKALKGHTPLKLALWTLWVGAVILAEHWNTQRVEHVHYLQYGVFGALLWPVVRGRGRWRLAVVLALGFGVGLLDEGLQGLTKGRVFDWADAAYNVLGVLGGVLYFWSVTAGTEASRGRVTGRASGVAVLLCAAVLLGAVGPVVAGEPAAAVEAAVPLPDPAPAIAALEVPPEWLGRHPDPGRLPGVLPVSLRALANPFRFAAEVQTRGPALLRFDGGTKLLLPLLELGPARSGDALQQLLGAVGSVMQKRGSEARLQSKGMDSCDLALGLAPRAEERLWHLDRAELEQAVGKNLGGMVWLAAERAARARETLGVWLTRLSVDERQRLEQAIRGVYLPTRPAPGPAPALDLEQLRGTADLLADEALWYQAAMTLTDCARHVRTQTFEPGEADPATTPTETGCASGDVRFFAWTAYGPVIVGGPGPTEYSCEDPLLIVDVGGDDVYQLQARDLPAWQRVPVSVIVDHGGDDRYLTDDPGMLGGGFFGVSVLVDAAGDDVYVAGDIALGAGALGVGVLIDSRGNDSYQGRALTQGAGALGLGWLWDGGGNDRYAAGIFAQGAGGFQGSGTLLDAGGNDEYSLGGLVADFREPDKGTVSYGQGYGFGHRELGLAGGAGWLFDLAGHDTYQASYFAQGAATFFGLGVLHDGGDGGDRYLGRRYVQGAGVHLGAGLLVDEAGSDLYEAFGVAQGCGHDQAVGLLVDGAGNDRYDVGFLGQGAARAEGLGILLDGAGQDRYWAGPQGTQGAQEAGEDPRRQSIGLLFELRGRDFYTGKGRDGTIWRDEPGRSGGADLE